MTPVPRIGACRRLSTVDASEMGLHVLHVDSLSLVDDSVIVVNGWLRIPVTCGSLLGWA